jgi:hypothetical protein
MSQPNRTVTISFMPSMSHLDPEEWNALAEDAPPFMRWEWLNLLEVSGAVHPETGWLPSHCVVFEGDRLIAAAPLYVKMHGLGEFVYDQLWSEAARSLGLPYYPKLTAANPFTPAAGYRFLSAGDIPRQAVNRVMLEAMDQLCRARGLSGLHVLFAEDFFADELENLGLTAWEHQGFLWTNQGYGDFKDFLARFRTSQRKSIRRERERLLEAGVRVTVVAGQDAPDSWFALMHHYYEDTNDKFGEWGCKFLPLGFFEGLAGPLRESLAFSAAFLPGEEDPVGLALLVHGGDTLYGRYWGAAREIPFLHFELCYYAPIEWAIAQGVRFFDPGMGGEHKPRRGFDSRATRSMHRFYDPLMEHVFNRNVPKINEVIREHIKDLQDMSAFKADCGA